MNSVDYKGKVLVMGVGWVGGALYRCLEENGWEPLQFDPPKGMDDESVKVRAEVAFICVPTPHLADSGFDLSFVRSAIDSLPDGKIVVVKSTVLPGTTEALQKEFPQHKLLFNPEFLRQVTADDDMRNPDRQIMGYTEVSKDVADAVLKVLPHAPFMETMPATEAETVKYFGNCFLAMKVVFANQVYDLCNELGIDYDTVRHAAAADPRIGDSHLQVVHDGFRGYGGSCFPKDVKSFLQLAERADVDMSLLGTADKLNEKIVAENKETLVS